VAETYTAPSGLSASSISASRIDLSWNNTETAPNIEIQRKASGGTYSTVTVVSALETDYINTSCNSNTHYYYRIRYVLSGNTSAWSTASDSWTYPGTPTGLACSFSGKTATLSWTNVDSYTYIKVYYKLTSSGTWTTDTETLSGSETSRQITVASENTTWNFRICGYNSTSAINSSYATLPAGYATSGIMAPTELLLTSASTTSVTVAWVDNSSVEDGYEVYYGDTLFETTAADAETSTITGLEEGTEYTIKVRAKVGTAYSEYATDTIYTGEVPDAPLSIGSISAITKTSMTVSWTCDATNEDGFSVYRSTDDITYTVIGEADEDATSYTDTGLDSYTTYYYAVRAYNAYGVSDLSGTVNGTTLIDLDPPTGLYAEALSSTQIKLSFTVNADNATAHYVYRKTSGGTYSYVGSTIGGTTATFTDGTCLAETEYTYRIRAYNSTAVEYGDYSVPVTKKTLAIGTDTVRRNEAFFAMGNVLCIASETPQNSFDCYWRSKPIDFSEIDPADGNRFKTVYVVQLEYTDTYADVPIVVSLSTDGGTTWTTSSETVGTGDLTDKIQNFNFAGVTGKYITLKISTTDSDTGFTWTGIIIHYISRGEYSETT
jgi:hypothetical protein